MKTINNYKGETFNYSVDSWFVIVTDTFLKYCDICKGKTCKRVIICKTHKEAQRLADALLNSSKDLFSDITATNIIPCFHPDRFHISVNRYQDYNTPLWMQYTEIPE